MIETLEIRHFHLFCGLGGGAKGFNRGHARVGNLVARYRCIGGVDVDAAAIRDFNRAAGVHGTVLDMFDREQYQAFHGCEPPATWCEATPEDIRRAAGGEYPDIVFLSAPCKGFSGLLSENRSRSDKYQALNRLTLRGIWLMLEAFRDELPRLIAFENVPRIMSRGSGLLQQIRSLLEAYGYAVVPLDRSVHDCGELGGLAQSRKRFLMVARHMEKVPPFLYSPPKRPLRAVGEILGRMPMPGDPEGGPMHSVPNLQWKTWVRLAFVEAGSDWRSLNKLRIVDGKLADYLIVPEWYQGILGVRPWSEPSCTVTGRADPTTGSFAVADPRIDRDVYSGYGVADWERASRTVAGESMPSNGQFAVADPRFEGHEFGQYGVRKWEEPSGVVTSQRSPGQGCFAVADPRPPAGPLFSKYAVTRWDGNSGTVIGGDDQGAYAVQDPRMPNGDYKVTKYKVTTWDEATRTVIAGSTAGDGAFAVADPRLELKRKRGDSYFHAGHYGVVPWDESCGAVSGAAGHDSGRWNVADPRTPEETDKVVAVIRALDGTWHRPFTTLELAALQSLVDPGEMFNLDGDSDSRKRERIGNAVPPAAAQAMADVMGHTLLLAHAGESFQLSATPIWVRPIAIALSVRTR